MPQPPGRSVLPPSPDWPIDGTEFTARLTDGTPIPTQRAREILLNAGYSALVLGTDGHPLYLGRTVRCATPHQRRALIARYPTCVVHDCDIPGALCRVDHVTGWANWGPTDIDKLTLTCRFHNNYKHEHPDRVHITAGDDGRYVYQINRSANRRQPRTPAPASPSCRHGVRSTASRRPGDQPPERGP